MHVRANHKIILLLLLPCLNLLLPPAGAEDVAILSTLGFHEGGRRELSCADGSFIGVEVSWDSTPLYAEDYISSLRLICSGGVLEAQYLGRIDDALHWGKLENRTQKGVCKAGAVVGGLRWRLAQALPNPKGKPLGPCRLGSLAVVCVSAMAGGQGALEETLALEAPYTDGSAPPYDQQLLCSDHSSGRQGLAGAGQGEGALKPPHLSKVAMWWSGKSWAGLDILEC